MRPVAQRVVHATLPWLIGLALWTASSAAFAREPTAEDRTTARELAFEGHDALQAHDYALAADRFARADALVHAPTLLAELGRSYVGLGQLVKAHEVFQQVLREGVSDDAPAPWRKAVAAAQDEDAALKPRLAWVTIRVDGPGQPSVKLDDEDLSRASLGVRRAVDPGHRTIVAEAEGYLSGTTSVDLKEGETRDIQLELKRDPNYRPPRQPRKRERVVVVERSAPHQRTAAYVAFSVGVTGLLLGGVSTGLTFRARSDLQRDGCRNGHCPPSAAGDLSRFHTFGTLAALGLGVGLAGAGVGTYFWLSRPATEGAAPKYTVTAQVSPGYVGIGGRF